MDITKLQLYDKKIFHLKFSVCVCVDHMQNFEWVTVWSMWKTIDSCYTLFWGELAGALQKDCRWVSTSFHDSPWSLLLVVTLPTPHSVHRVVIEDHRISRVIYNEEWFYFGIFIYLLFYILFLHNVFCCCCWILSMMRWYKIYLHFMLFFAVCDILRCIPVVLIFSELITVRRISVWYCSCVVDRSHVEIHSIGVDF